MKLTWYLLIVSGIVLGGSVRSADAVSTFSWENDLQNWFLIEGAQLAGRTLTPKSVADGAPAEAITDGDYALEMTNFDFANNFIESARGPGATQVEPGVYENVFQSELLSGSTLDFDIYVTPGACDTFDFCRVDFEIEFPNVAKFTRKEIFKNPTIGTQDGHRHVTWDYADSPSWPPSNTETVHIDIILVAGLNAGGEGDGSMSMSPVYIDNLVISGAAQLPGDYNLDNVVDAADYAVWRNALASGDNSALNGNGNEEGTSLGVVDADDYALWRSQYGMELESASPATSSSAAPEPASLLAAALGSVLCLASRRV